MNILINAYNQGELTSLTRHEHNHPNNAKENKIGRPYPSKGKNSDIGVMNDLIDVYNLDKAKAPKSIFFINRYGVSNPYEEK